MKHIRLYEEENLTDLIGDLDKIGFEPYTGYMFSGNSGSGGGAVGFLVEAANEKECVDLVKKHILDYVSSKSSRYSTSAYGIPTNTITTIAELLEWLFEQGFILDAGHYGPFKSKTNQKALNIFVNSYDFPINPLFFIELAKKHFSDAERVIGDSDYPEEFKY